MSRLRDWFELGRLADVFAVMSDPLAGALVVGAGWRRMGSLAVVMLASGCLYAAGAALNDWSDFKKDLTDRPNRPLPSKRIRRFHALLLAIVLFAAGGALTTVPGPATRLVGLLLIAAILLYDILMKEVPIAPAAMGVCRSLNLLLGMTLVPVADPAVGWSMRIYLLAAIGVYVLGITVFARREALPKQRRRLLSGSTVTWLAVLAVGLLHFFFPDQAPYRGALAWVGVLMLVTGYRMSQAMLAPEPGKVQAAVRTAILGAILFDAAAVAFSRGLLVSLPVVFLLIPAIWLGKA